MDHPINMPSTHLDSGVTTNHRPQIYQQETETQAERSWAQKRPTDQQRTVDSSTGRAKSHSETSPQRGNWEWDERTGRANSKRFVDGMASLTSDSNEAGYLGKNSSPGYM